MDDTMPDAPMIGPPSAAQVALPAPLHQRPPEDESDLVDAIRRQLEAMLPEAPAVRSRDEDAGAMASALAGLAEDAARTEAVSTAPAGDEPASPDDPDLRTFDLLGDLNRLWRRGAN